MLKQYIKRTFIFGMSISLFVPSFSHAYGEASEIRNYVDRQDTVPLLKPSWANFILHLDKLNLLYSSRSYNAIWVNSQGVPNEMASALKETLLSADRHGLDKSEYWDDDVEKLFNIANKNQKHWISFELMASEALIRYVTHLSTGRVDPDKVDPDIRFERAVFNDYEILARQLGAGVNSLSANLDRVFAPKHSRYLDLMDILFTLKNLKNSDWSKITSPGFVLKTGVNHPVVAKIRSRLNQLGYSSSERGGSYFDDELEWAVMQYQSANGMTKDGIIGITSEVLRGLNTSIDQRIKQTQVTMEKLRWLPKKMADRHIFINLATTEFWLFDDERVDFHFKTVNGGPFNRTPSMKDAIGFVNFNPDYTVAPSSLDETISNVRRNKNYLSNSNMLVIEKGGSPVDPQTINWTTVTKESFDKNYYFRQLPGPGNALGVVKFPLLYNNDFIYLHDTDRKELFGESKRHRSHGCVRLEQPLHLSQYLLEDKGWTMEDIKALVPQSDDEIPQELKKIVRLTKEMPVYLMYLTVEKTDSGGMRFVNDVYGQDYRLMKALENKKNGNEIF